MRDWHNRQTDKKWIRCQRCFFLKTVTSDDHFLCGTPPSQRTDPTEAGEMMKGICVGHFDRLCLSKMHNRNVYETDGSSFSWISGAQTPRQRWMNSCWATEKCPALFNWLLHTQEEKKEWYRKNNGKRERRRRCFIFFFLKDSMEYQTLWVLGFLLWVKRKSSERPLLVCDFSHLLCTVKSEKEDAPLPTNYLYVWTFAFCLFQYKKEKEQKICLMISEKSPVWSGSL